MTIIIIRRKKTRRKKTRRKRSEREIMLNVCRLYVDVFYRCVSIINFACLGQVLNPYGVRPPSSNGYQVERKLILCECLQLQKMYCILPREMILCKSEFQYLGVIDVKSSEPTGISRLEIYVFV